MPASIGASLTKNDGGGEKTEIEIALQNYRADHTAVNLKKLCIQIVEFCRQVYASTQNDSERQIYNDMIAKLNK